MSKKTVNTKVNSVHPSVEENDAIKIFKRSTKKRNSTDGLRLRTVSNRVPDETMNLKDTFLNVDTSVVLIMIGCFKLLLLAPLLLLGVVLVSMKSSGRNYFSPADNSTADISSPTAASMETTAGTIRASSQSYYDSLYRARNDSVAPIWTALMLAASTAMDFISACQRAGNTIIVYMLVATVAFVACILCIEYDRIEINSIEILMENGFTTLSLHHNLYAACIGFAAFGVLVTIVSMFVGSKMAELEQQRLYMERDGLPAVLTKKDGKIRRFVVGIAKRLQLTCFTDVEPVDSVCDHDSSVHHEVAIDAERQVCASNAET